MTVREGLWRLAALYAREINEAWEPIWMDNLRGIPPERVSLAFAQIEREFIPTMACPFPTPAHILEIFREEDKQKLVREAEAAWQHSLKTIYDYYHPDFGWKKWTPKDALTKRMTSAVEAAGGAKTIYLSGHEALVWIKKEFLAAFEREPK